MRVYNFGHGADISHPQKWIGRRLQPDDVAVHESERVDQVGRDASAPAEQPESLHDAHVEALLQRRARGVDGLSPRAR